MAMKKIYIGFFLAYEGETASHMDKSSILARFEFSWQVQAQLRRSADMLWPVNSQTEGGRVGWGSESLWGLSKLLFCRFPSVLSQGLDTS